GVAASMTQVERALAARIAADHNTARSAAGLRPLHEFDSLAPYAGDTGRAMRASGELAHSEIILLLNDFPRNMWAAENSLVMHNPASDAVGLWMDSHGHAANMMAERATHLWVDVRCAADGRMWVTTQFVEREVADSDPLPGHGAAFTDAATSDLRCPVGVGPFESADDFVAKQYADFLGREADAGGLSYWASLLNTGQVSPSEVILAFLNSEEFAGRIRPHAESALLSSSDFPTTAEVDEWRRAPMQALVVDAASVRAQVDVFMIYVGMLDRTPDTAGFDYWTGLASSGVQLNDLVDGFLHSVEYRSRVS
ncbi:MAG: DUF4214 domain-containing protein, partial [Acidimicrobiia bacterium]